jgi:hypothetical protein
MEHGTTFSLWSVAGDGVEDVDEDEEECDQKRHPAGNHVGGHHKTDPGNHNKQPCNSSIYYLYHITVTAVIIIHIYNSAVTLVGGVTSTHTYTVYLCSKS